MLLKTTIDLKRSFVLYNKGFYHLSRAPYDSKGNISIQSLVNKLAVSETPLTFIFCIEIQRCVQKANYSERQS